MTPARDRDLGKITLFSIFLFGSVLLIITIIASDLMGGIDTNGYVRSTPALVTPPGFEETLEAAPTRRPGEGQGLGDGQGEGHSGEGREDHQDGPTPTIDFTTYPTEDDV